MGGLGSVPRSTTLTDRSTQERIRGPIALAVPRRRTSTATATTGAGHA